MIKEVEITINTRSIICDGCDAVILNESDSPNKFLDYVTFSAVISGCNFCDKCILLLREWAKNQQKEFVASGEFKKYVKEQNDNPDILQKLRTGQL